jgi:hypothetical protein
MALIRLLQPVGGQAGLPGCCQVERFPGGDCFWPHRAGGVVADGGHGEFAALHPLRVAIQADRQGAPDGGQALTVELQSNVAAEFELRAGSRGEQVQPGPVVHSPAQAGAEQQDRAMVVDVADSAAHALFDALHVAGAAGWTVEPAAVAAVADLTDPEQRLVAAARAGQPLDLAGGEPIDAEEMDGWGPERTVRAGVLRDLLLGRHGELDPRGVQLRGARIDGVLDLDDVRTPTALRLTDCHAALIRLRRGFGFATLFVAGSPGSSARADQR